MIGDILQNKWLLIILANSKAFRDMPNSEKFIILIGIIIFLYICLKFRSYICKIKSIYIYNKRPTNSIRINNIDSKIKSINSTIRNISSDTYNTIQSASKDKGTIYRVNNNHIKRDVNAIIFNTLYYMLAKQIFILTI